MNKMHNCAYTTSNQLSYSHRKWKTATIMDNVKIHRTGADRWLLACCIAAGFSPVDLERCRKERKEKKKKKKKTRVNGFKESIDVYKIKLIGQKVKIMVFGWQILFFFCCYLNSKWNIFSVCVTINSARMVGKKRKWAKLKLLVVLKTNWKHLNVVVSIGWAPWRRHRTTNDIPFLQWFPGSLIYLVNYGHFFVSYRLSCRKNLLYTYIWYINNETFAIDLNQFSLLTECDFIWLFCPLF